MPSGWDSTAVRASTSPRWARRSAWPSGWCTPRRGREPLAALGVDPLTPEFTVDALADLLPGTSATLKTVLTTQSLIAGVGNAYSDEALHVARPLALQEVVQPRHPTKWRGCMPPWSGC